MIISIFFICHSFIKQMNDVIMTTITHAHGRAWQPPHCNQITSKKAHIVALVPTPSDGLTLTRIAGCNHTRNTGNR